MPNAAIIITGDFNRLDVKQIINQSISFETVCKISYQRQSYVGFD